MQCTPDGTIIYKNKRCGDGLPAPNGMTDKRGGTGEEEGGRGCSCEMKTGSTECVESACHALTATRGHEGNGTNQIRIKSQARKSLGNSIKGKNTLLIKISWKYASEKDL